MILKFAVVSSKLEVSDLGLDHFLEVQQVHLVEEMPVVCFGLVEDYMTVRCSNPLVVV